MTEGDGVRVKAVLVETPGFKLFGSTFHDPLAWRVRCPFCRASHEHKAGMDRNRAGEYLGPHFSHCKDGGRPYYLVETDEK